jgi:hypothetical protein
VSDYWSFVAADLPDDEFELAVVRARLPAPPGSARSGRSAGGGSASRGGGGGGGALSFAKCRRWNGFDSGAEPLQLE